MKLYSSSKHCPPCIIVKQHIESKDIQGVETVLVSTFEEMPAGAKSTPCLELEDGFLIHNSEAIIKYLNNRQSGV